MKIKGFVSLLILMAFSMVSHAQNGHLEITIEGIKNSTGQIGVLLFNQAKGFPKDSKTAIRNQLVQAKKGKVTVVFEDVPFGAYAVTVMHDENNNLELDTNFLGIPKEGYGFSNNPKILFRAPRFADSAFELKQPRLPLRISMNY